MPILDKPIRDYEERFGHSPPPSLIKSYAQGWTSEEEILGPIAEALRTGVPVKAWKEYKPVPGTLEEEFYRRRESGTPTPCSPRSPSSEDEPPTPSSKQDRGGSSMKLSTPERQASAERIKQVALRLLHSLRRQG